MRSILLSAVLLALAPLAAGTPALAQSWQFTADPDGRTAIAYIRPQAVNALALFCTLPGYEPIAWGQRYNDNHPPAPTDPGRVRIEADTAGMPRIAQAPPPASGDATWQVDLAVDGRLYPLPPWTFDLVFATLQVSIPAGDPLLDALKAGSTVTLHAPATGERVALPLRGSGRAISALQTACPGADAPTTTTSGAPTTTTAATATPPTAPAGDRDAVVRRDMAGNVEGIDWVDVAGSDPALAVAFVYLPSTGGNSVFRDVFLYRAGPSGWARVGKLDELWGIQPRDARMRGGEIEIVTTMLKDGDPRCCPTGTATYRIDPGTARMRRTSLR